METLFKLPASSLTGNEFCLVYRYHSDGPMELHPEEIDDGLWISPEEMDRRIEAGDQSLTEALVLIWKNYRDMVHETA